MASKRKLKFPNPLKTLRVCLEKDMGLLLLYNSIVYTAFYCITSTTPQLFAQIYGFNTLQIGLTYIPFGVGAFIAPVMNGRLLDWNFKRVARSIGMEHLVDKKRATNLHDFPLERARIYIAIPLVLLGDACILCYGWVLERNANLAAPLVLQFILGVTLTGSVSASAQPYIVMILTVLVQRHERHASRQLPQETCNSNRSQQPRSMFHGRRWNCWNHLRCRRIRQRLDLHTDRRHCLLLNIYTPGAIEVRRQLAKSKDG